MTKQALIELLNYDPETGIFTWKKSRGCMLAGSRAGNVSRCGYWRIFVSGHHYYAHRLAWLYVYGKWPENVIDHIDRNPLNNRINNLRDVTQSENLRNTGLRVDNTSGFAGVSYRKKENRWVSHIRINGKRKSLGTYRSLDDAVAARKAAERDALIEGAE